MIQEFVLVIKIPTTLSLFFSTYIYSVLLTMMLFVLVSCENDLAKVKLITLKDDSPNEIINNVEVLYTEHAQLEAKLLSPELNRYESDSPYVIMPKGLQIFFYNDSLVMESKLTANYGIYLEKEERMEAKNNVVVVNAKGEKLNTEHLIWDEKNEKIYSDVFVKITTAEEIIYGDGFESNQNFTQYKIFNIKGTINIEKNDTVKSN